MIDLPPQMVAFRCVSCAGINHIQRLLSHDQAVGVGRRRDRRALDRHERDSPANLKPVVLARGSLRPALEQRQRGRQPDGGQLPQGVGHGRGNPNLARRASARAPRPE